MVRKRLPLIVMVLGGLLLSFFIVAQPVHAALPEVDDPCPEPSDCLVPTPTVIQPNDGFSYQHGDDVVITGLSWNQTKVDVYIDGSYNGRAELRMDPSEIGNFFYRPYVSLAPGTHNTYTVARNLSENERSPQSPTREFTIIQAYKTPVASVAVKEEDEVQVMETDDAMTISEPPAMQEEAATDTKSVDDEGGIFDWFFNSKNATITGSTTATSTASRTSLSGKGIVTLVVIIAILFFIYRVYRSRQEQMGGDNSNIDSPSVLVDAVPPKQKNDETTTFEQPAQKKKDPPSSLPPPVSW